MFPLDMKEAIDVASLMQSPKTEGKIPGQAGQQTYLMAMGKAMIKDT